MAAHVTGHDQSSDFLPPTLSVALFFGLHISLLTDNSEASCQWPHVPSIISVGVKTQFRVYDGRAEAEFSHVIFFLTRSLAVWIGQTWQGSCLCEWGFREGLSPTFCTIFCMLLSHNGVKKNVKCLLDNSFGFVTVYICRMWMYFLHVFCL